MRILWTDIGDGPPVGGQTARSLRICAALLAQGAQVELALLDRGLDDGTLAACGIEASRVHRFACWNRRYQVAEPAWRRMQALVARADLVVLTTFLWGVAPWAWRAARRAGKPWVVNPSGLLPYFGRSLALKQAAHRVFGASMLRDAAALIAVTAREAQELQAYADAARIAVVPNGVDLDAHRSSVPAGAGTMQRVQLLFLGRLETVKGADLLLEALAGLPPHYELTLAGDGSQRAALQALCERRGLRERVRFAGFVEASAKHELLSRSDWVVIPSRRDAMTLVALEAAAQGVPVLLTRECGFPELAAAGAGIEADASVDGLREGLLRIAATRAQWPAMRERAQRLARERYGWDAIARRHLELFAALVSA